MRKPKRVIKTRKPSTSRTSSTSKTARRRVSSGKKAAAGPTRGAEGFARARNEQQRRDEEYQRKKDTPFDFRLKPGESAEVVVLDADKPVFYRFHKVKSRNGRWEDAMCIADQGVACPLCSKLGKEGSFTMVLTVLDRRPYKIKNGPNAGKTIKYSKKLLMVKGRNLAKFERQWNKYGSRPNAWRGLRIACHRSGEKEAAIGEDLEFQGILKEAILKKYKAEAQPADYEKIFAIPTAQELSERYNVESGVAGSEEFGDDDDDDGVSGVSGW